MEVRLTDTSINEVRAKLNAYSEKVLKKVYNLDPNKVPLKVIVKRGNVTMDNGEWLKEDKRGLADKLTFDPNELKVAFNNKNLNLKALGFGGAKGAIANKLKKENRDLDLKVESLKSNIADLSKTKKKNILKKEPEKVKGILTIIVSEKGSGSNSKDLENAKLKELGYVGLKKWTEEQLDAIANSDKKLDKVLSKILKGEAKLKDKVEEVLK